MERAFSLKRGVIDLETGEFPLTLFTNGPASDPHIVDVKTAQVADRVTMFVNHEADPRTRMGGMINPHKVGKKTVLAGASLKMDGIIDMEGDNAMADIRRDVAQGISVGDVTAMSVRWDGEGVARSSLKETHYAYSNVEGGWETPLFFANARVLEGSIVGVPADAAALIGRSRDLNRPAHVRDFYRVLVNGDPLSRDKAMADLFVAASDIDGLEEIELDEGVKFFVPVEVARVWGQSIEDAGPYTDAQKAGRYGGIVELEAAEQKYAANRQRLSSLTDEQLDEGDEREASEAIRSELSEIGLTAAQLSDPDFNVKRWILEDSLKNSRAATTELEERLDELTDSEPLVPEPKSETKEESEPLRSEPTPPQTVAPVEVLPTLRTVDERRKAIDKKFDRWRYLKMGWVK